MSIAVLGGGAFGTALAIAFASDGPEVTLWMRDREQAERAERSRRNERRLPDAKLPRSLKVTSDLAEIGSARCTLLALPAQQTQGFLQDNASVFPEVPFVFCAKGLTRDGQLLQTELTTRSDVGVLTGPGFAGEIAGGLPTALTIAAEHGLVEELQSQLSRPKLRLYRSTDKVGAQLGGALKNVVAIASGIAMGAGFGESARAALVTRGFAEMRQLARAMGARDETLTGLSGFGDLMLTCASEKSRNFAHGFAMGRGEVAAAQTVEGIATARATVDLGRRHGLEMPIASAVSLVLNGQATVSDAVSELLARPLRAE